MLILGIDPGERTGWAAYDTVQRRCVAAGEVEQASIRWHELPPCDVVVIERPEGQGATRPQVVDCAWYAGILHAYAQRWCYSVQSLTRRQVCGALAKATQTPVKGDSAVWWALCDLHGGQAAGKKSTKARPSAGCLSLATGHARAALAVAWAAAPAIEVSRG